MKKAFVPMGAWKQAQESYLLLYHLTVIYSNGVVPGTRGANRIFAMSRPAYLGTYNPELEYEDLSPERQYEQVTALLNDMFVTVGAYVSIGDTPNDDMLMEGLVYLQHNQVEPPMWLLFACQNFLNIHFTLKTRVERPFEELRDYALYARRTVKAHQAFIREHPMPKMRSNDDEEALDETLQEIEEWVLEDKIKQELDSASKFAKGKKKRIWQEAEVLRMSPVLCGMWKYCFHIQLQWKGITLLNDTGMLAAAHLYNALRQNGYLDNKDDERPPEWADMEYLLDIHKAEDTFMGKRPQTIEDCTKRLALVQGVAPQTFARRRRGGNHRVLRSRAGSRFLTPSTPVAKILGQRYLNHQPHAEWHLDQLDVIVSAKFAKQRRQCERWNVAMEEVLKQVDLDSTEGKNTLMSAFGIKPRTEHQWKHPKRMRVSERVIRHTIQGAPEGHRWASIVAELLDSLSSEGERDIEEDRNRKITVLKEKYGNNMDKVPQAELFQAMGLTDQPDDSQDEDPSDEDELEDDDPNEVPRMRYPVGVFMNMPLIAEWEKHKTIPLDTFVSCVEEALAAENLDIQFDYFAFFRSVMSMLLNIQQEVLPILQPRLHDNAGHHITDLIDKPEGALCVIPNTCMLVACDPMKAPNLLIIRPWLEVNLRPLEIAASVMQPWIKEHGDDYIAIEDEREGRLMEHILKDPPPVRYLEEDNERRLGYASTVGVVEGLNAREMREVYDHMRKDGPVGSKTTAEAMAELQGYKLTAEDKENIRARDKMMAEAESSNKKLQEQKRAALRNSPYRPKDDENEEEDYEDELAAAEAEQLASNRRATVEEDVD